MDNKLIIVFGLPGAGKTYVADLVSKHFGYYSFNGDDALPIAMKNALINKSIITDAMRQEFTDSVIVEIEKLLLAKGRIVIHQTFLKEFMRLKVLLKFPDARFVLVTADDPIRENRYQHREYFNLGIHYLRHMSSLFDTPTIPHTKITNSQDGPEQIIKQLKTLIPH